MKTTNKQNRLLRAITVILMLVAWGCTGLYADSNIEILKKRYTSKRPLVVTGVWDLAPYEFQNEDGQPSGFFVDVTNTILNRLGIPHVFVLKERSTIAKNFSQRKADLRIGRSDGLDTSVVFSSKMSIYPFVMGVAYRRGTPPLHQFKKANALHKILLKDDGIGLEYAQKIGLPTNTYSIFSSGRNALQNIQTGRYAYMVWGKEQLKWYIREYGFTNIKVDNIDIMGKELRFLSHDRLLINVMEDQFARLAQTEELHQIAIKWFNPEKESDNDVTAYAIIVLMSLIILAMIIIFMDRKMKHKMSAVTRQSKLINSRIKYSLENTDIYVISMNVKSKHVTNIYRDLLPNKGITEEEYIQRCHLEDRPALLEMTESLKSGTITEATKDYRWNKGTPKEPSWYLLHDKTMAEYDANGKVTELICAITDITADQQRRQENQKLANEYRQIFEHSITGVAFYDAQGHFLDANTLLLNLCIGTYEGGSLLQTTNLFQIKAIRDSLEYQNLEEDLFICTNSYLPGQDKDMYQELCVRPILNSAGNLIYYFLSIRNITEERQTFILRKQEKKRLRQANEQIIQREEDIKFLFEKGDIRSWKADFTTNSFTVYKTPSEPYRTFSIDDYIKQVHEFQSFELKKVIQQLKQGLSYSITHKIRGLFSDDEDIHYYTFTVLPHTNEQGEVTSCFGLVRDITSLRNAEEKLKQETEQANDSGHLKSVFIANMSHEIRTPLNAIVGFSDLIQSMDSPEDRKEFIHIIRNNSDMLLRLINDILTSSSIDSRDLKIEKKTEDFSHNFDDLCIQLERRVTIPDVTFIKDNPTKQLIIVLDQARINQVITNFVTNAVKYTQKGHIKVGYRQQDHGIYIYCEDTGAGIPKEQQAKVFERFVKLNDYIQGTGLGLAICKSIAEACGGKIGVNSEVGKGSTFWIWIPEK